ncbi:MAG: FAD-dependent monooxygenase [Rhodomicrobium sp.]|nr:FAD-dependent monooxygenase [Rhodomicrobium sp.]
MAKRSETDVIVVGGGTAGLAAALACQQLGLVPAVADTSKSATADAAKGRSAALFNRTVAFLQKLGVWEACAEAAEPLRTLQFIDDTGRLLRAPDCAFHASEIGESAFGYNISNADLARVFKAEAGRRGLEILFPGRLVSLERDESKACVTFEDGTELRAPLIIAADGRASPTREAAGIRSLGWSYGQTAIAASFSRLHRISPRCWSAHADTAPRKPVEPCLERAHARSGAAACAR